MAIFYKSLRVGRYGRPFWMYKFKTLKDGSDGELFASGESYTRFGRFLRKYKFDEWPQIWNVLKGEMGVVGPRPEEERSISAIPEDTKTILLSVKPGMTSLSSVHFFDEEKMLQSSNDVQRDYWTKVKPMKILLDVFYVQNRSVLLKLAILWQTLKRIILR